MTKTIGIMAGLVLIGLSTGSTAQGSGLSAAKRAAAEALGGCISQKTTGEDRVAVAGWMLAAMASSPDLRDVAAVSSATKERLDRKVAQLYTRLMTVDCRAEAKAAFATRDPQVLRLAGEPLGRVAMTELMGKPEFSAALTSFTQFVDDKAIAELGS